MGEGGRDNLKNGAGTTKERNPIGLQSWRPREESAAHYLFVGVLLGKHPKRGEGLLRPTWGPLTIASHFPGVKVENVHERYTKDRPGKARRDITSSELVRRNWVKPRVRIISENSLAIRGRVRGGERVSLSVCIWKNSPFTFKMFLWYWRLNSGHSCQVNTVPLSFITSFFFFFF